jgi:hypothetical protein
MWKKLKLSSDGGDSVARNADEAMVGPVVGSGKVCVWQESGVCISQIALNYILCVCKITYF